MMSTVRTDLPTGTVTLVFTDIEGSTKLLHELVAAAAEGREALRSGPIQVRVGMHTGTPHLGPEGYVGEDVHLGARVGAAGHGGQVLISEATRGAAGLTVDELLDLGEHRLKDFERAIPIFQLGSDRFPPLKTISNTNL